MSGTVVSRMTRALILPSLSLSPWTSCQARAPIPALSLMRLWGGSQRQEFEASALQLGPPRAESSQTQQSQSVPSLASVPRCLSVGIPVLPAPPYPPAATSIDICCSSTPGKHHMLTLVGNGSLPPRLEERKNKRNVRPSPGQAQLPRQPRPSLSSSQASCSQ